MRTTDEAVVQYLATAGERKEHPYHMWDSIQSTPRALSRCLDADVLDQAKMVAETMRERQVTNVVFCGCGSSYFASIGAACCMRLLGGMRSSAENPFELLHYPLGSWGSRDALIVVSHSGSTEVDIHLVREAVRRGVTTVAISDVPESPLASHSEFQMITGDGLDPALPKTRSFTSGLFRALLLAFAVRKAYLGEAAWADELRTMPEFAMHTLVNLDSPTQELALRWTALERFVVVGAGPNLACAHETALKLMEMLGASALGLQLEEAAHGPELSLNQRCGVIVLAPYQSSASAARAQQVARAALATGARVAVVMGSANRLTDEVDAVLRIGVPVREAASPVLFTLPLQMLAYRLALAREIHPDLGMASRDGPLRAAAILRGLNPAEVLR